MELSGSPEPTMIRFHNMVGVDIGSLSKKLAVKSTHSNFSTYFLRSNISFRLSFVYFQHFCWHSPLATTTCIKHNSGGKLNSSDRCGVIFSYIHTRDTLPEIIDSCPMCKVVIL